MGARAHGVPDSDRLVTAAGARTRAQLVDDPSSGHGPLTLTGNVYYRYAQLVSEKGRRKNPSNERPGP